MSDNTFVLRTLFEKCAWQVVLFRGFEESVQHYTACFVVAGAGTLVSVGGFWTSSILCMHMTAQRTAHGLSEIFSCLMGLKQGCSLSFKLFDALEKHLLDTDGIDAPTLGHWQVVVPMLLYADDLIPMSATAPGLQKQLRAFASFCQQRQLTFDLGKTKVVMFEGQRTELDPFFFNSRPVDP